MSHNPLRLLMPFVMPFALAAFLFGTGGCGGDSGGTAPVGPDLSTPEKAIDFMVDAYGFQEKRNAIGLLDPEYTFHPAFPESIAFLGMGETFWDYEQEVEILDRLLEPGRVTWLDQVLLEIDQVNKIYLTEDQSLVEIHALTDLLLLVGADSFLQGRGDIVYTFRRDANGNYLLLEERESPDPTASLSVGENKARVMEEPGVPGGPGAP